MKQLSGPCPGDNCPKLFDDGDSYVVQGEITEYTSDCTVPIVHQPATGRAMPTSPTG